jgi:hypothetical protein
MMKKQVTVNSFDVRFTGKQAKAIEAVAKTQGITPEAMVRQAVREALDKASGKSTENGMENYVLNLLTRGARLGPNQRLELEKAILATLSPADAKKARASTAALTTPIHNTTPARGSTTPKTAAVKAPARTAPRKKQPV